MKIKNQILGLGIALGTMSLLAACGGNSEGESVRPMSDYKNMTAGDSMAYYIGQASSLDYWKVARRDTVMLTRESRDEFLRGIKAGMDGVRDNDAYNQGYYMGVQMAMQMKEFSEDFKTTYNKNILVNAFSDGLKNDSIIDAAKLQQDYTELINSLQERKEAADKAEAEEILKEKAAKLKLQSINPTVYAAAGQGGEGAPIKVGEHVGVSIVIKDAAGKDLDRRDQPDVEVGKMFTGAMQDALTTMKVGETRTFYTYSSALFGRMYQRYGLKSTDIVTFTITTSKAEAQPKVSDESAD